MNRWVTLFGDGDTDLPSLQLAVSPNATHVLDRGQADVECRDSPQADARRRKAYTETQASFRNTPTMLDATLSSSTPHHRGVRAHGTPGEPGVPGQPGVPPGIPDDPGPGPPGGPDEPLPDETPIPQPEPEPGPDPVPDPAPEEPPLGDPDPGGAPVGDPQDDRQPLMTR